MKTASVDDIRLKRVNLWMHYLGRYSDVRKLFKHEFKATGRHFILMYIVFIIFTLFNKLFLELSIPSNKFFPIFKIYLCSFMLSCVPLFLLLQEC